MTAGRQQTGCRLWPAAPPQSALQTARPACCLWRTGWLRLPGSWRKQRQRSGRGLGSSHLYLAVAAAGGRSRRPGSWCSAGGASGSITARTSERHEGQLHALGPPSLFLPHKLHAVQQSCICLASSPSLLQRKSIIQWGGELQLGGYSKPGFPGIVLVEVGGVVGEHSSWPVCFSVLLVVLLLLWLPACRKAACACAPAAWLAAAGSGM